MKTNSLPYLKAGLAAALITPVFALEAPADDSPPPPALEQEAAKLPEIKLRAQPEPAAMAQTAFLGVVSGHVPEVLADHLDLKPGEGVIVRSLVPDGPAAKAGITVNDVITRVAGQAVGSPLEITRQIASHQPGESLTLELIHKGKSVKLDVTLGLKPAEMAALEPPSQEPLNLEDIPKELADRLRQAIEGNLGGMDLHLGDEEGQIPPRMDQAMRDLRKRLQGAMGQAFIQPADDDAGKVQVQSGATIRMMDNQAEWVAEIVGGEVALPPEPEMRAAIEEEHQFLKRRYPGSPRYALELEPRVYLGHLAKERTLGRKRRTGPMHGGEKRLSPDQRDSERGKEGATRQ